MNRDDAIKLVGHMSEGIRRPGTTTAAYHGYNAWTVFIVKNSRHAYGAISDWSVPGLFIAYDDLKAAFVANRPYLTLFYVMDCGKILVLVLPVIFKDNEFKIPNNLTVLKKNGLFFGDRGFWISVEHWYAAGFIGDYIVKEDEQTVNAPVPETESPATETK